MNTFFYTMTAIFGAWALSETCANWLWKYYFVWALPMLLWGLVVILR